MSRDDDPDTGERIPAGDPRYDGFRLRELWAYLAVDPADDQEGVAAFLGPGGMWMPMIGGDERRIRDLEPQARQLARHSGRKMRLVKFTVREDLKEIDP